MMMIIFKNNIWFTTQSLFTFGLLNERGGWVLVDHYFRPFKVRLWLENTELLLVSSFFVSVRTLPPKFSTKRETWGDESSVIE